MKKINTLFGIFFASGFAALAYQIYFAKKLALVFGSQSSATYTVLAIYMAGMAIGAAIGAGVAKRTRFPVRMYAMAELAIALYCLCTPFIFSFAHDIYLMIAVGYRPDSGSLVIYQVLLGALVLLFPTILMGLTFPLLVRAVADSKSCMASISWFYSANTFGAASGALLSGYLIIPALGMNGTLWLSSAIDIMVALLAFLLVSETKTADNLPAHEQGKTDLLAQGSYRFGLFVLLIVGALTMMMEVSTIHLLAVVIGNSTYAFSLMLTCFLAGLALGGKYAGKASKRSTSEQLNDALFLLTCTILCSTFLWHLSSLYFYGLAKSTVPYSFWFREFLRAIPAVIIALPPAFAIGALYPVSMTIASKGQHDGIGFPSAINTLGNIAGVLLAGFLLLPAIGGFYTSLLCGVVAFTLLLIATWKSRDKSAPALQQYGSAIAATILLIACPKQLDLNAIATGINTYFKPTYYAGWKMIDHAESADGGLTAVMAQTEQGKEFKTLTTNGKFQGNNVMEAGSEMLAQAGFGLIPMLHLNNYDNALVIGYGTGVTAMAIHESGFKSMEVVDLSRDLVNIANRHFADVNQNLAAKPGVSFLYTDGRNHLSLTDKKYDLIAIQLSSIWFAGAASLYNQEFYALAKSRLADKGILKQWFQLAHMSKQNLRVMIASLSHSFRYVWIYNVGKQGAMIASNSPDAFPDAEKEKHLLAMANNQTMKTYIDLYKNGIASVSGAQVLNPEQVKQMLALSETTLSNDDNLLLEYSTPKGNAMRDEEFRDNIDYLKSFARSPYVNLKQAATEPASTSR
ncbi:fused MFS/spermidine synthase [Undibacterium sp. TC4M20W]|uniref:fused MFS/spermidine synthase n=1 Tax=Undibacterium sp. TC4M20W TaxID=3413052 RepID=UPI003BF080A0